MSGVTDILFGPTMPSMSSFGKFGDRMSPEDEAIKKNEADLERSHYNTYKKSQDLLKNEVGVFKN